MIPSVNYYHYSVFKLLVVNLRTRFGLLSRRKKPASARLAPATPVRLRLQTLASDPVLLTWPLPEKFSGSGDADSRSKATTSTLPAEN
jgi:hypothetical protein